MCNFIELRLINVNNEKNAVVYILNIIINLLMHDEIYYINDEVNNELTGKQTKT